MKRVLAAVLICVLLLLSGCAQKEKGSDVQEIDVVLDWYPNALHAFMYVAIENGYYEAEGLKVNIRFPSNINDAISLVAAGQADVGLYYQQDVIQARANQNIPVKSIGAVVQSPLNILLSLKEEQIDSPEDLAGKMVGYAGTELSEAIVSSMMQHVGADISDVDLVDVGFDLMSSMTTGNVNATIGCFINHEVPQLIEEGFELSWLRLADYGVPSYYEGVFLASDKAISTDRDLLAAFLRASAKGFEDVKADPQAALKILLENQNEENFPLSESVEKSSLDMLLPLMESDGAAFLSQADACWQENIDWMYDQGLINRKISVDDVRENIVF